MSLLTCHFLNIGGQECIIIEPKIYKKFTILHANVISLMKEKEFEIHQYDTSQSEYFYGYLGHFIDKTNGLNHLHIFIKNASKIGTYNGIEIYRVTELAFYFNCNPKKVFFCSEKSTTFSETFRNLADLGRWLTNGLFYFGFDIKNSCYFDLSLSFDKSRKQTFGRGFFTWNNGMLIPWRQLSHSYHYWATPIINGSVEMYSLQLTAQHAMNQDLSDHELFDQIKRLRASTSGDLSDILVGGDINVKILLISRLSWAKAGARFLARGVNDDGFVGNFVETEQVMLWGKIISCFTQIRGSVPVFWSQNGSSVGFHKFDIHFSLNLAKPSFEKHFKYLVKDYNDIMVVSLLNSRKAEGRLNLFYSKACSQSTFDLKYAHLDYHADFDTNSIENNWVKNPHIKQYLFQKSVHVSIIGDTDLIVQKQLGVIRTNCVDCLDRTNNFQAALALTLLDEQLHSMGILVIDSSTTRKLVDLLRLMWANNGNNCSKNYAGTDALEKNKISVQSIIKDTHTSIKRALLSSFSDARRHMAITRICDLNQPLYLFKKNYRYAALTCLPNVMKTNSQLSHGAVYDIIKNIPNFIESSCLKIHTGVWNIAGGCERILQQHIFTPKIQEWLLDSPKNKAYQYRPYMLPEHYEDFDFIVVGLQEMVDLTASNILYNSDAQMNIWVENLTQFLSRNIKYILVTSVQLVGICLFVFSKEKYIHYIQDVSTSTVKTGLGGTAGNKGGVAISMTLYSSSFCFVCSHFAAGNSSNNFMQRNKDFDDISRNMMFERNRKIYDHDYIFWLGDLNYRINDDYDNVRTWISRNKLSKLLENDQLINALNSNLAFKDFKEGQIQFMPTYKYDFFSTNYDTSEKARAPAYTDRILWWQTDNDILKNSNKVDLIYYGPSEHLASDHRPISSLFHVKVRITDNKKFFDVYMNILKRSPYGQFTIKYSLSLSQTSSTSLSDLIGALKKFVPPFDFYRFERNNLLITYSYVNDIYKFPEDLNILGFNLKLKIYPTVSYKDLDKNVIEHLRTQSTYKIEELPECSHETRPISLVHDVQMGPIRSTQPKVSENAEIDSKPIDLDNLLDLISFEDVPNMFLGSSNLKKTESIDSSDTHSLNLCILEKDLNGEANRSCQSIYLKKEELDEIEMRKMDPFFIAPEKQNSKLCQKSTSNERLSNIRNPFL